MTYTYPTPPRAPRQGSFKCFWATARGGTTGAQLPAFGLWAHTGSQEAAAGIPEGFSVQTWPYAWVPGTRRRCSPGWKAPDPAESTGARSQHQEALAGTSLSPVVPQRWSDVAKAGFPAPPPPPRKQPMFSSRVTRRRVMRVPLGWGLARPQG